MAEENNTLPDTPDSGGESSPPPAETSLHDDIARAFDEVQSRDAPPDKPGATAEPAPVVGQPPAPAGERARDPVTGQFTKGPGAPSAEAGKPPAAPAAAPGANGAKPPAAAPAKPSAAAAPPPADPLAPPPPQHRAPTSWKPGAREHWAKLPTEVQAEVVRRETEVAKALQESGNARSALSHVQQVLGPYAHNVAAAGSDVLTMMGNLFRADNTLRHGSVQEKAALIGDIIKSYGVDIATLDAVLAGAAPPDDPTAKFADQLRREMQQQMQPLVQFVNSMQGQRRNALNQINTNAVGEVEAFGADAAHEFFEDVRNDMADIIDLYTQRGVSISLQDAYDRAIKLNPHVSEIVAKRAEAERASAAAAAAQRAKRAAASITSAPAPAGAVPGPAGEDRRSTIARAWDDSQGS